MKAGDREGLLLLAWSFAVLALGAVLDVMFSRPSPEAVAGAVASAGVLAAIITWGFLRWASWRDRG